MWKKCRLQKIYVTIKVRINQEFRDETQMSSNKPFMFFMKLGLAKGSWVPFFIWDEDGLAGLP